MAPQLSALTALEEAQGLTPRNHITAYKYLWLQFQESWNPWQNSNAHKIEKIRESDGYGHTFTKWNLKQLIVVTSSTLFFLMSIFSF